MFTLRLINAQRANVQWSILFYWEKKEANVLAVAWRWWMHGDTGRVNSEVFLAAVKTRVIGGVEDKMWWLTSNQGLLFQFDGDSGLYGTFQTIFRQCSVPGIYVYSL